MANETDGESSGESAGITCAICLERIQEDTDRMYGILENCDHTFCLTCIKRWRASNQQNRLMCPQCRTLSHLMIPSRQWFRNQEEKRAMIAQKMEEWSRMPCRFYRGGLGVCRYNELCRFSHDRDPSLNPAVAEDEENNVPPNINSFFNPLNAPNWVDIFATEESEGLEFYIPIVMDNITSSSAESSIDSFDEQAGRSHSAEGESENFSVHGVHRPWSPSSLMEMTWCPEIEDYMLENDEQCYEDDDDLDSLSIDSDMLDGCDDISVGFSDADNDDGDDDDDDASFEAAFLDDLNSVVAAAAIPSNDEPTDSWSSVSSDRSNSAADPEDADPLGVNSLLSSVYSSSSNGDYYGSRCSVSPSSASCYDDSSNYNSAAPSDNSGLSSLSDQTTNSLVTETSSSAFSENDFEFTSDSQSSITAESSANNDSEASSAAVVLVDDLVMRLDVLECSENTPPNFPRRRRS